jgi:hypothetical protein
MKARYYSERAMSRLVETRIRLSTVKFREARFTATPVVRKYAGKLDRLDQKQSSQHFFTREHVLGAVVYKSEPHSGL